MDIKSYKNKGSIERKCSFINIVSLLSLIQSSKSSTPLLKQNPKKGLQFYPQVSLLIWNSSILFFNQISLYANLGSSIILITLKFLVMPCKLPKKRSSTEAKLTECCKLLNLRFFFVKASIPSMFLLPSNCVLFGNNYSSSVQQL